MGRKGSGGADATFVTVDCHPSVISAWLAEPKLSTELAARLDKSAKTPGAINAGAPEVQLTTYFVLVFREDVSADDTASLEVSAAVEIDCVIGAS